MSERVSGPLPDILLRSLGRLMRPLVRLAIRSGVTFPVLADLLRDLYVDVAQHDVPGQGRARTDSRISLLTGIHRKEIRRQRSSAVNPEPVPEAVSLSSQIVARWLGAAPWASAPGVPHKLPRAATVAGDASFDGLVEAVTKDMRPRAVLDEWLSQELVTIDAAELVTLNVAAFVPKPGHDAQMFYFGRNLHDHIAAAVANVSAVDKAPFLDRSVHYDALTPAAAAELELLGRESAVKLLLEINSRAMAVAAAHDVAAGSPTGPTRRVNLGVYLYVEDEPPTPAGPVGTVT